MDSFALDCSVHTDTACSDNHTNNNTSRKQQ